MVVKARRSGLLKNARRINCDTLVAFEPENLYYLTGFWGEAIGVLEKDGTATIIAPELEAGRAKEESVNCDVVTAERGKGLVSSLVSQVRKKRVCTDCQNYQIMRSLKRSIPKLTQSVEPFYEARSVKDEHEISVLKKGSKIIDEMFNLCQQKIKVGMRESELQGILMSYAMSREMFDTGYKSTLNPLIVAGGPNGALPHAQVTNRKFRKGDMIVVDLTLRYKGYVSDATRTFGLGKLSDDMKLIYEIVRESQKLGLKEAKPRKSCKMVDSVCREFIQNKGFGEYFIHSTGHGIGLEVHEPPNISHRSKSKLKKNMAITVEPGIYLPNKFGVRIEDSLIVRDNPIILHKFTKDLVIV